jgi:hypothetical protein
MRACVWVIKLCPSAGPSKRKKSGFSDHWVKVEESSSRACFLEFTEQINTIQLNGIISYRYNDLHSWWRFWACSIFVGTVWCFERRWAFVRVRILSTEYRGTYQRSVWHEVVGWIQGGIGYSIFPPKSNASIFHPQTIQFSFHFHVFLFRQTKLVNGQEFEPIKQFGTECGRYSMFAVLTGNDQENFFACFAEAAGVCNFHLWNPRADC